MSSYWRKREAENLANNLKDEKAYKKELDRIYKDMLDACQKEIDSFYGRYADKEGISIAEAKKRVSKLDIEAYERKAEKYVKEKNFSKQANEEMLLYNLTMKVNRLEMLKANIGLELIAGHEELNTFMEKILNGRTEDELKRQAGILGKTVRDNAKLANSIVNGDFHNASFSQRLWANQSEMKADLSKMLERGMLQGKNARTLTKELRKYFIGDGKKVGKNYAAERLMVTELARVQTEAQKQSFIANGFDEYTFIVNGGCCDICAAIAGKNFKVDKMMPGENAPPMHPWCRCSIAAYEDSDDYEAWLDYLDKGGTTAEWNKLLQAAVSYEGIPKTWKDLPEGEDVLNVNPLGATDNCVNCCIAYEMRLRNKAVVAAKSIRSLMRDPFAGWRDHDVRTIKKGEDVCKTLTQELKQWGTGSRVQVSLSWNVERGRYSMESKTRLGHSIICEMRGDKLIFIDPQKGKVYNDIDIEKMLKSSNKNDVRYCRIDTLDITDLGATACQKV